MVLKSKNIIVIQLLLLGLVYSQSTPWPKNIGLFEVLTAILLILLFSKNFILYLFDRKINLEKIIFIYFIIISSFLGVVNNTLHDFIRDLIPFFYFYLGITLIYTRTSTFSKTFLKILPLVITFIGLVYSLRTLYSWKDSLSNLGKSFLMSPDYIAQSPSLTFASSFLLSTAILLFIRKKKLYAIFLFFLGLLPLIIFFAQVLRAPSILVIFFTFIYFLFINQQRKISKRVINYLIIFFIFSLFILGNIDFINNVLTLLSNKQKAVGSSGKLDEYIYAFQYLSSNIFVFLFGEGFGGLWLTPFDTVKYSFAHSIIVYYFIKGGLIGFILYSLITIKLLYMNIKLFYSKNNYLQLLAFSIFPTLLINLFLEPGYKTLSFGFLILILYLADKENKCKL